MSRGWTEGALRTGALALCLALAAGCAVTPTIRANQDATVDFSQFQSFSFFDPLGTDRSGYLSLISQQLVAATERELVARGLRRDDRDPDLLVNFNAALDQRLRVTTGTARPPPGFFSHRSGFYGTWPTYQEVRPYTQGTLLIDVVDPRRRQLVWEGVATRSVSQRTADDIGPVLDDAVTRTFARFPIPRQDAGD